MLNVNTLENNPEDIIQKVPPSLIKFDEDSESESENEEEENIITFEGYLYKNIKGKNKKIKEIKFKISA